MVTKADLKIEAARLATEVVNEALENGQKLEFTPLAEEIYDFLIKDLDLKETASSDDLVLQMASMLGGVNTSITSTKQEKYGSGDDIQDTTKED